MKEPEHYYTAIGEKYTITIDGTPTELTVAKQESRLLTLAYTDRCGNAATAKMSEYSLFTFAKAHCEQACQSELEQMAALLDADAGSVEDNIRYCGCDIPEEVRPHLNHLQQLRAQCETYSNHIATIEQQHNEKIQSNIEREEKPLRHLWQSTKAFVTTAAACIITSYILTIFLPMLYLNNIWFILAVAAVIAPLLIIGIYSSIALIPQIASAFIMQHKARAIPSIVLYATNGAWLVFLCFGSEIQRLNGTQIFVSIINSIIIIAIYTKYINSLIDYENTRFFTPEKLEYSHFESTPAATENS